MKIFNNRLARLFFNLAVGILGHGSAEDNVNILTRSSISEQTSLLLTKVGRIRLRSSQTLNCLGLSFELFRFTNVSLDDVVSANKWLLIHPAGDFSLG